MTEPYGKPIFHLGNREVKTVNVTFRIVNVVATAALDRPMDLESLHKLFPHEVIHD